MLFSIRQFEQHIGETALRQGLRLFQKGAVELLDSGHLAEWRFTGRNFELMLRKKGDKLISYHCSCKKNTPCQHLAASLFLLQKEDFNTLDRTKKQVTKTASKPLINQLSPAQALAYLQNRLNDKNTVKALDAALAFDGETVLFTNSMLLLERVLDQKQLPEKLNQGKIKFLASGLAAFLAPHPKRKALTAYAFYLHLAAYCQLQKLLQLRFTGNEAELREMKHLCCQYLDTCFRNGLNHTQNKAWQKALLFSLSSNPVARSGGYSFLLPRFLCLTQSTGSLQELSTLVEKRRTSPPRMLALNPIAIARHQIYLKEQQLKRQPIGKANLGFEESIAHIDLLLCCGKAQKAFKLALQVLDAPGLGSFQRFSAFADYVLEQARSHANKEAEQRYLEFRLLYAPFMNTHDLQHWLTLLPEKTKQERIDTLLRRLKEPAHYSFEKLSAALKHLKRTDALIQEIKQHGQAFYLLHDAALEKLPAADGRLLDLYCQQFTRQLNTIKLYSHQIHLFETALKFINGLKEEQREALLQRVTEQCGSESQISKHIYATCNL